MQGDAESRLDVEAWSPGPGAFGGEPVDDPRGPEARVSLVSRVRQALLGGPATARGAGLGRDAASLLCRVDRLRQRFPDATDLLERVGLSPHVIRLLDESREQPLFAAEGGRAR